MSARVRTFWLDDALVDELDRRASDICNEAKREHNSRPRIRSYRRRDRREGDVMCVSCCCWFHPKGIVRHEDACHG